MTVHPVISGLAQLGEGMMIGLTVQGLDGPRNLAREGAIVDHLLMIAPADAICDARIGRPPGDRGSGEAKSRRRDSPRSTSD